MWRVGRCVDLEGQQHLVCALNSWIHYKYIEKLFAAHPIQVYCVVRATLHRGRGSTFRKTPL